MLKNLLGGLTCCTVAVCLIMSCSSGSDGPGENPENKKLTIETSKEEIASDGVETAFFTVRYGDNNVTGDAVITNITTGEDLSRGFSQFVSTTPGDMQFVASYDGKTSNTVKVTVIEPVPDDKLILKVDREFVIDDGQDAVKFTIILAGTDVTSQGQLYDATSGSYLPRDDDNGFSYSTSLKKTAEFIAKYEDLESEPVYVQSISNFRKNVLVSKFTGTWCNFCYPAGLALEQVKSEYGDRMNILEIHYNDPLVSAMTPQLHSQYSVASWPSVFFDYRERLGNSTAAEYRAKVGNGLRDYPASCGFSISNSVYDGTMNVKVNMLSTDEGEYRLVVALLESGITGLSQKTPSGVVENHVFDDVLRNCANSSAVGENLGTVPAMTEITREYTFDIRRYEQDNCHLLVYALRPDEEGKLVVDNSASCPVADSVGYPFDQ